MFKVDISSRGNCTNPALETRQLLTLLRKDEVWQGEPGWRCRVRLISAARDPSARGLQELQTLLQKMLEQLGNVDMKAVETLTLHTLCVLLLSCLCCFAYAAPEQQ